MQFWWKKTQKYSFDSKHTTGAPNTFALVEKFYCLQKSVIYLQIPAFF